MGLIIITGRFKGKVGSILRRFSIRFDVLIITVKQSYDFPKFPVGDGNPAYQKWKMQRSLL
jgi:hypothetical protein